VMAPRPARAARRPVPALRLRRHSIVAGVNSQARRRGIEQSDRDQHQHDARDDVEQVRT
jgi:hypothetical protein